ncbi:MAG: NAD(P)/FAD-dependent oxidoreductase [Deltaproteobacteria bacterium]|nr:NAD(P)/FAD-dependent oxidoreductase [Deltaproteobacteria bacterium]
MKCFDVIIIGAGAAGMMCAIEAAKRQRRVLLIDHSTKLGRKILISGGGRCNFTNIHCSTDNYQSENPHFCKSALSRFTSQDFIHLVEKYKIPYHEKKLGQLFCTRSAHDIVHMLKSECDRASVKILLGCSVSRIDIVDGSPQVGFTLKVGMTKELIFQCRSLVIATGGLSIPKLGATNFGYKVAEKFGLNIIPPRPALDGFVFTGKDESFFRNLSGISFKVKLTCNKKSFIENILITHRGLSGPAALQGSLYWNPGDEIKIEPFAPLPHRFVDSFLINFCSEYLNHWKLKPSSTIGYRKAEVTKGGVDTNELSSQTMESQKVPGLYFIGEVVDVTGWLGGSNFQWAWSSGWAAGQAV